MASFDNLYVRHIHFHGGRRNDTKPVWGSGWTVACSILRFHTVFAFMVVVSRNPTSQDIKKRTVIPFPEILRQLPTDFQNAMLSWLIVAGEEEPSSVVDSSGIERERAYLICAKQAHTHGSR